MIGEMIGSYRLVAELGAGATGDVYYAEHTVMGRRAAIKVLSPQVSADEDVVARFINEARSVNDIRHPNIVEITDFGRHRDRYYILMELLEGETLEERLDRCPRLDAETIVRIATQVGRALHAAHKRGFVHRDLKPENIFLLQRSEQADFVKVLDFGTTNLIPSDRVRGQAPATIVRTPYYMSPERCRGQDDLDARSDIYSLGVVCYRMATGALPFAYEKMSAVLVAHINDPPVPPREHHRAVPPWLDAVILRAMAKDPADRYQTMSEIREALQRQDRPEAATGRGSGPDRIGQPRRIGQRLRTIVLHRLAGDRIDLPVLPAAVADCLRELGGATHDGAALAPLVLCDPQLSSQIVRLANDARYTVAAPPISSVDQALARLGPREFRRFLYELSVRMVFHCGDGRVREQTEGVFGHSVTVALIAEQLAAQIPDFDVDLAHLAGLVHDAGKPIVAAQLLEAGNQVAETERAWLGPEVFAEVIEACHRELGVALARAWQLPDAVVRSIDSCGRLSRAEPWSVGNLVCVANALAKQVGPYPGPVDTTMLHSVITAGLDLLGIEDEVVERILANVVERRRNRLALVDGADHG